jgi:hypothetical protein
MSPVNTYVAFCHMHPSVAHRLLCLLPTGCPAIVLGLLWSVLCSLTDPYPGTTIILQASHCLLCVLLQQGAQPLYWGATEEGQLLLGSHLDELEGCSPTATMFPPGAPDCMLHVSCFWILEVDVQYWDFAVTAVRVYSTFTVHALASSATSRVWVCLGLVPLSGRAATALAAGICWAPRHPQW